MHERERERLREIFILIQQVKYYLCSHYDSICYKDVEFYCNKHQFAMCESCYYWYTNCPFCGSRRRADQYPEEEDPPPPRPSPKTVFYGPAEKPKVDPKTP